jgi:uncharacterized protein (DUF305 family)
VVLALTSLALVAATGCGDDGADASAGASGSGASGHGAGHSHGHGPAAAGTPTTEGSASSRSAPAGATVVQPGRPGEKARTLPPDATLPVDQHNAADVTFLRRMIPHHAQALAMGDLARTRAGTPRVRALAARIHDAQGPEIVGMSAWLQRQGLQAPSAEDVEEHATHMSMPGMLTRAQMRRLREARGREFDVQFLRAMTRHHRGAVQMAQQVMRQGRNVVVGEMAADIAATQTAEIDRMQQLLRSIS